jgi:hypothetical protein
MLKRCCWPGTSIVMLTTRPDRRTIPKSKCVGAVDGVRQVRELAERVVSKSCSTSRRGSPVVLAAPAPVFPNVTVHSQHGSSPPASAENT